jgi:hypothetical protein
MKADARAAPRSQRMLDEAAKEAASPRISLADPAVSAWVIPTNENLMVRKACAPVAR